MVPMIAEGEADKSETMDLVVLVLLWSYAFVFVSLMILAMVGSRLMIRKKYVEVLDRIFKFAEVRLDDKGLDDEEEDACEESVVICPESPKASFPASHDGLFGFDDPMPYMAAGMRAVVQDCVTKNFYPEELRTWNMLSRTKRQRYLRQSPSLTAFWLVGCVIRYVFLMPTRVLVFFLSISNLVICTFIVGLLPNGRLKKKLNTLTVCWGFDVVCGSISVVARFYDQENRPSYGIAVANHTSPIDSMILATNNCYDMVGQRSKGILGVFMGALSKSSSHIWFERSEARDRSYVSKRLEEHAKNSDLPPLLVFPEGICVNNTAVMQFKKGAFEIDSEIHPIAIRFDPRYGDPFWWQDTFWQYIFYMMTSWAIVCDIWYLPPMRRRPNESSTIFAERVKAAIAHRGNFVQVAWDGALKFWDVDGRPEAWREKKKTWTRIQQKEFARKLSVGRDEEKEKCQ